MTPPTLDYVCTLTVQLDPIIEMGDGRAGVRRIIPIVGGTVSGPKLKGKILTVGADWQTVFADGTAELDTRYAMETDDGAIIEIVNFGYRHGPPDVIAALAEGKFVSSEKYYMRTHARLETGDPRYSWVNRMIFVGTGSRQKASVEIEIFAVA